MKNSNSAEIGCGNEGWGQKYMVWKVTPTCLGINVSKKSWGFQDMQRTKAHQYGGIDGKLKRFMTT